jgi:redox-sensitive bicupin YhaK (pirin superfamily)
MAGFPVHPHRGIETVTFVAEGEIRHKDSLGHRAASARATFRWMTSGSGILHEEMPQVKPERNRGTPALAEPAARAEKMSQPKYRDLVSDRAPGGDETAKARAFASSPGRARAAAHRAGRGSRRRTHSSWT